MRKHLWWMVSQIAGPDPSHCPESGAIVVAPSTSCLMCYIRFIESQAPLASELKCEDSFLLGVMAERSKAASLGTGLSTAFFGRGFESHSRH